jgi:hypothetical protein
MSFEQVEEAWTLSDTARDMVKNASGPVDLWAELFSKSPLVDVERTQREGGNPMTKIFLKSPYGLQFRPDHKDWIPFRHGEVKLPPL